MDNKEDISNYQENGEFKLESFKAVKNCKPYSCCPNPFPDITYYIELRRRPMFYVFNLILPCVLINGIGNVTQMQGQNQGHTSYYHISLDLSITITSVNRLK